MAASMLSFSAAFAQNNFNQYSIEASYGYSNARPPVVDGFNHFDIGFRYMQNEFWGGKVDYGYDRFKSDEALSNEITINRTSIQAVYNLGRGLRVNDIARRVFNLLLHSGVGLTSINLEGVETDWAGNFILGGTGQLYLNENFALTGDLSGVLNFSQDYAHNGNISADKFTGKVITLSVGITYYFGRNKSTSDWR
jgi:hypothetical protein